MPASASKKNKMAEDSRKKLRRVTIVFWVLLFYIIAALLWWLLSLEQQNESIHELKRHTVRIMTPSSTDMLDKIDKSEKKESIKYVAEGVTFLLLIVFGAAYIYRLVRRQFRVQQQQQNFVMGVTHELKTPLSVVRLNLETLQKHQLDTEKQKKIIQSSLDETIRLDTLINNILISSELDTPAYVVAKEKVDLSSLVNEASGEFAKRHPHRNLQLQVAEGLSVSGDPLLLKLLVSNLLENAHKYSPGGAPVKCILKMDKRIRLCVIDEGHGIPDGEKKKIFDKFYRVGNEETRKTKGTGLGLFICSKIAQYHSARITVTDNHPHGTNFTVSF
jgi:two-component system, OmpR family, sensor histidine kinase CiaH